MSLEELENQVNEKLKQYQIQKEKIENQIQEIPILNEKNSDQFTKTLVKSEESLISLINHSSRIEKSVESTYYMSQSILKDFDKLKYRKINVEVLLNTMTTFIELKRIIPVIQKSVQENDMQQMIKQCQTVQGFQNYLLEEYCKEENEKLSVLMDQMRTFAKELFDKALKTNDAELLNKSSQLSKLLKLPETSLDQVIVVYSSNLQQRLKTVDDHFFESVNANYKSNQNFENYQYPFYEGYIQTLGIIYKVYEEYSENIYKFYGKNGLVQLLKSFLKLASPQINGIIKKMNNYYMLDQISLQNDKRLQIEELNRLEIYCDEVSGFSSQNENFNKMFIDDFNKLLNQNDGQPQNNKIDILRELEGLDLNNKIIQLMGIMINYQEIYLKQRILVIVESNSFGQLKNFDKSFFIQFYEKKEPLYNISNLYEYLDDIFYLISNAAKRSLETMNKSVQCSGLNFLCHLIQEEILLLTSQLITKYMKKDYFNPNAIGFNQKYTVHNSFIIIMLNNVEMLLKYLKQLKKNMLIEYQQLCQEYKKEDIVVHCISELNDQNEQLFKKMLTNQIAQLVEFLKTTTKPLFEEFKQLNFTMSEQQIQDYERSETFSQMFKSKFNLYLNQWMVQLTKENFKIFFDNFCLKIADQLENLIMAKKFHRLGAMILDKELRDIIDFLNNYSGYSVKIHFAKIQMISEILILENIQDMQDFYKERAKEFSQDELRRIVRLRATNN